MKQIVGFELVYVDLEMWQFMFLFNTSICILELFGEIMFSPIYNTIRHDLNEWINSLFLSKRKKNM